MGSPVRSTIAGSLFASAYARASDVDIIMQATLRARSIANPLLSSVAVLTAGAPADIATFTIPPGIVRWVLRGNSGITSGCYFVNESQSGTMANGTMAVFDAASGGGVQIITTLAPAATSTPTLNSWAGAASNVLETAQIVYVRQMANSLNAGNISFYLSIIPIP